VAVKLPGYIHILYFRPSAEHKTTALLWICFRCGILIQTRPFYYFWNNIIPAQWRYLSALVYRLNF
jgi:hypothetical protein